MASNRTKVLRHQHPLDPSLVKVLSSEERERLRACLPSHVTRDSAEIACDELERAFAIYRSGLANRVSKRPDEINADLDGIEGFISDLPDVLQYAEKDNRRRILRHLSGDRANEHAVEMGQAEFDRICARLRAAVSYARSRIRDDNGKRGPKGDTAWLHAELVRIWEEATGIAYRWSKKKDKSPEEFANQFIILAITLGGAEADYRREYTGRSGGETDLGVILDKHHKKGIARLKGRPRSSDESDRSDDEVLRKRKPRSAP